jgi:hypothetical protein
MALIDAIGSGVARVIPAPVCLGFLAAGGLACGVRAGALSGDDSRIRIEPPPTDPAGPLPVSGHPRLSASLAGVNFSRAGVGQFSKAPKRFLDPVGVVVGLRAKGAAKGANNAFVVLAA